MPGARKDSPNPVGHGHAGHWAGWAGRRGGEGGLREAGEAEDGRRDHSRRIGPCSLRAQWAFPRPWPRAIATGSRLKGSVVRRPRARRPHQLSRGFRGPSTLTLPAGRRELCTGWSASASSLGAALSCPQITLGLETPRGPGRQSSPTLYDPTDCSPPGSSVLGILQTKNTGVGCHVLLQEILLTQGWNLGLPHCRQTLYLLSYQESPGTQESLSFKGYPPTQVSPTPPGCGSPGLSAEGPRGRSAFQPAQPTPHNSWGLSLELRSFGR